MKVKFSVFLSIRIVGILFPIQSLKMHSNSQRLPVTQYRLHSEVIVSLVINYHTLSVLVTPRTWQFYSFYWMKVKFRVF